MFSFRVPLGFSVGSKITRKLAFYNSLFALQRIELVLTDLWPSGSIDVQRFVSNYDGFGVVNPALVFPVSEKSVWVFDAGTHRDSEAETFLPDDQSNMRAALLLFDLWAIRVIAEKLIRKKDKLKSHFSLPPKNAPHEAERHRLSFLLFTLFALYEQITPLSFLY